MPKLYSVRDFADMLGVSKFTVYKWIYCGDVRTIQIKPKSAHRIPESEVKRFTTLEPMTETQPAPEA